MVTNNTTVYYSQAVTLSPDVVWREQHWSVGGSIGKFVLGPHGKYQIKLISLRHFFLLITFFRHCFLNYKLQKKDNDIKDYLVPDPAKFRAGLGRKVHFISEKRGWLSVGEKCHLYNCRQRMELLKLFYFSLGSGAYRVLELNGYSSLVDSCFWVRHYRTLMTRRHWLSDVS